MFKVTSLTFDADIVILANLTTVGVIAQKTSEGETHMVSEKDQRKKT